LRKPKRPARRALLALFAALVECLARAVQQLLLLAHTWLTMPGPTSISPPPDGDAETHA
jgi:hypothetical protein